MNPAESARAVTWLKYEKVPLASDAQGSQTPSETNMMRAARQTGCGGLNQQSELLPARIRIRNSREAAADEGWRNPGENSLRERSAGI
ncbi:MAG: hypothetical protein GW900_09600 [Gammaproteobacteria bacterium]|nr:hypothetical protein [Gammaproteobacteria bacterium]